MSTQRIDQLKQELAQATEAELTAATDVASAGQRLRAARRQVSHLSKQLRVAEAQAAVKAAYEASLLPGGTKQFF